MNMSSASAFRMSTQRREQHSIRREWQLALSDVQKVPGIEPWDAKSQGSWMHNANYHNVLNSNSKTPGGFLCLSHLCVMCFISAEITGTNMPAS